MTHSFDSADKVPQPEEQRPDTQTVKSETVYDWKMDQQGKSGIFTCSTPGKCSRN